MLGVIKQKQPKLNEDILLTRLFYQKGVFLGKVHARKKKILSYMVEETGQAI